MVDLRLQLRAFHAAEWTARIHPFSGGCAANAGAPAHTAERWPYGLHWLLLPVAGSFPGARYCRGNRLGGGGPRGALRGVLRHLSLTPCSSPAPVGGGDL